MREGSGDWWRRGGKERRNRERRIRWREMESVDAHFFYFFYFMKGSIVEEAQQ